MSRYHSYLNSSVLILTNYQGEEPFAGYIKKFFAANKKYGSKDRKHIAHLCYCFFRLGKAVPTFSIDEKVILGLFLCSNEQNEILGFLNPEWGMQVDKPISDKLSLIDKDLSIDQIFPYGKVCSPALAVDLFTESFLKQPLFFLRIRPGYEKEVRVKLKNAAIDFTSLSNSCLALSNTTNIESVLIIDKEVVIQDYNSQRVAEFFPINIEGSIKKVWDCCAASGGKSILGKDVLGDFELAVSDVRENILFNLKKRFATADISNYKSFITNLTDPKQPVSSEPFDLIIADVPCSGSGTWSRTPEQLYYFQPEKIEEYATLQKRILNNIVKQLKPGGFLLYITCSVFKKENEMQVNYLKENFNLQLIKMELLKGYEIKADSMFAAMLQRLS